MKKFTDTLSPTGWILFALSSYGGIILLFRPTLREFLIFFLVDTLAVIPTAIIERPAFRRLYPDARSYFPNFAEEALSAYSGREKRGLVESFMKFPARRAKFVAVGSALKILPAAAVGIFVWQHGVSNTFQFLKFVACETLVLSIYYGMSHIELQIFVSRKIAELHARFDLTEAFETADLGRPTADPMREERLSLVAAASGIVSLLALSTASAPMKSTRHLMFEVLTVAVISIVSLGRLYYLNRRYLIGSLRSLSEIFASIDFGRDDLVVPLNASLTLAQFERTFNTLLSKLRLREQELGQWMRHELDQSRFRALGEISGLVVHDLASPLHVVRFCATELAEKPELESQAQYLQMLTVSTDRALELVESLKARLKETKGRSGTAVLGEAFRDVTRVLGVQFRREGLERRIRFELDPGLENLIFQLPRPDLVQILENVFRNSIENLLDNQVGDGVIRVSLHGEDKDEITLKLVDNGTGLSPKQFEALTAPSFGSAAANNFYRGLGLRLTRHLVERHLGRLRVVATEARAGTTFLLTLRRKDEVRPDSLSEGRSRAESAHSTPPARH